MGKWLDTQIALVGARDVQFPRHEVVHWLALRSVPERVRELLRSANEKMAEVESDPGLSMEGIRAKRAEVARQVLAELSQLMPSAEGAVTRRIEKLRAQMQAFLDEGKPKDVSEAQIAAEIRSFVARSSAPAMAALKLKNDRRAVSALLQAPGYLSGLSESDVNAFRREVLAPTAEATELSHIESALDVCQGAVDSAKQMLSTRAQLRQNSMSGSWEIF
jgi:hypothetical protein